MISGISKYSTYILLAALAAALIWAGALQLTNDRLQVQVEMYKEQAATAKTIDEMNKNTAAANQLILQAAIDKQNKMFIDIANSSSAASNLILVKLKEQQATTNAQYAKVTQAINEVQLDSCQALMDALIEFPHTGATTWGPVQQKR